MYPDQQNSVNKLRQPTPQEIAEKISFGEAQTAQQVVGLGAKRAYYGDECESPRAPTAFERLRFRAKDAESQAEEMKRALDILTRHPEFEELLWLIRSGLV